MSIDNPHLTPPAPSTPPPFLDLPGELTLLERSRVVILPVPYERTTTYLRGTTHGPAAILQASTQVEWYDEVLEAEPCRVGIHTLPPLEVDGKPEKVVKRIERRLAEFLPERLIVVLGGEHTVGLGGLRACKRHFPDLSLLVLDAHDDLRNSFEGSPYNHACFSRRAAELVPVVQVGVRSMAGEGTPPAVRTFPAHRIRRGMPLTDILASLSGEVYLSIDVDVFDPAYCPGVGTPEPGGLDWYQVTDLIQEVAEERRIVGFDVVELRPIPDQAASEFLAAKLVYRTIGLIARAADWLEN